MTSPPLSVVMPVRNALPYLDAAVESILNQSYSDFEFIIRDDASTDGTRERLRYWVSQDERIRLFEGEERLGPAGSSNWVVAQARAPIVARMDGDDISLPDRLKREMEILETRPDVVLVGSIPEGIDRSGKIVYLGDLSGLVGDGLSAPFAHGSIMFRRSAFDRAGGYRAICDFWEDLDLYARLRAFGQVLVIIDPVYQHRFSETSTRLTSDLERVENAVDLMLRCRNAVSRGEDYEEILEAGPRSDARRLNPHAFLSLGFITFWSGHRPATLIRLLKRGALRFDASSAQALVWAAWAGLSPRTLRALMNARLRKKNRRLRNQLPADGLCEWRLRRISAPSP